MKEILPAAKAKIKANGCLKLVLGSLIFLLYFSLFISVVSPEDEIPQNTGKSETMVFVRLLAMFVVITMVIYFFFKFYSGKKAAKIISLISLGILVIAMLYCSLPEVRNNRLAKLKNQKAQTAKYEAKNAEKCAIDSTTFVSYSIDLNTGNVTLPIPKDYIAVENNSFIKVCPDGSNLKLSIAISKNEFHKDADYWTRDRLAQLNLDLMNGVYAATRKAELATGHQIEGTTRFSTDTKIIGDKYFVNFSYVTLITRDDTIFTDRYMYYTYDNIYHLYFTGKEANISQEKDKIYKILCNFSYKNL